MKNCKIKDCVNPIIAKEMCWKHYRRILRNGTLKTKFIVDIKNCLKCGKLLEKNKIRKGMCFHCYYIYRKENKNGQN